VGSEEEERGKEDRRKRRGEKKRSEVGGENQGGLGRKQVRKRVTTVRSV
jgi:hypothetical protein